MKFLCVACDEAMALDRVQGPDEGSMTVVFGCPSCGREVAMLTNAMETQVVRSLGVKIGGRAVPAAPMETLREGLVHRRPDAFDGDEAGGEAVPEGPPAAASKCPFSGVVADAFEQQEGPRWTAEAEERLARIPPFARPMVRTSIEQHARERGYAEVDAAVMDEVRGQVGL